MKHLYFLIDVWEKIIRLLFDGNVVAFFLTRYLTMSANVPSRQAIKTLYKQLMRYGQELTLTDKNWYNRQIRNEFMKIRSSEADIDFAYRKGLRFLEYKRLV